MTTPSPTEPNQAATAEVELLPCPFCGKDNYHNHDRARIGDERDAEIEAIAERYIGSGDNIAIRRVGLADTITALVANRVGEERGRFKSAMVATLITQVETTLKHTNCCTRQRRN